jgi:SAM-dependent methyltransferase
MNEEEYAFMYLQEESHWWFVGMRAIVLSLLPPSTLPPSPRALDAGCGTGYNLSWFREQYGSRASGLDYYRYAFPFCRRRGERDLVQGDIVNLPFVSASFDLVASLDVLQQVPDEESRARAVMEFRRVLKPGGWFVIRVAAFEWLRSSHDNELLTQRRFGPREFRELVSGAGFQVVRFTFANSFLFPLAALWRCLKKVGLAPGGSDVRPATRGAAWLNTAMKSLLRLEAAVLQKGAFSFPLGLSLIVVARKPAPGSR